MHEVKKHEVWKKKRLKKRELKIACQWGCEFFTVFFCDITRISTGATVLDLTHPQNRSKKPLKAVTSLFNSGFVKLHFRFKSSFSLRQKEKCSMNCEQLRFNIHIYFTLTYTLTNYNLHYSVIVHFTCTHIFSRPILEAQPLPDLRPAITTLPTICHWLIKEMHFPSFSMAVLFLLKDNGANENIFMKFFE